MKKNILCLLTLILLSVLFISCKEESNPVVTPVEESITMSVVTQVIPFKSTDGVYNIGYHIKFSNYQLKDLQLVKAEVINNTDKTVIRTYADSTLKANFLPAGNPLPTQQEMMDGAFSLPNPFLLVWLRVAPANLPSRILHRMTFADTTGSNKKYTIENITDVSNIQPIVIAPPVKGQFWHTVATTSELQAHFGGIATLKGYTTCDGLFAVDFVLLNSTLTKYYDNDGSKNEDWYCYGKDLYAVADGKVVTARDIYQDTPALQHASADIPVEHFCGNELVIDIGNGNYADYAHIKPGSMRVKVGDNVKKGDVVAQIGNSGNSNCPHLHFEICRSNPPYQQNGVPYVIDKFELYFISGRGLTGPINQTYTNTLYEDNSVVHFIF